MVKLKNLKRRLRVFNLEHPTFVDAHGEHGPGRTETLTLMPRETKDVHPDVLKCVEVASALDHSKGRRPTLRVAG